MSSKECLEKKNRSNSYESYKNTNLVIISNGVFFADSDNETSARIKPFLGRESK